VIVNSTDLKNKLGKYLRDCAKGEIIITSSGRKIAKLLAYEEDSNFKESPECVATRKDKTDTGHIAKPCVEAGVISEEAKAYDYYPKKISYEEFLELAGHSEKRYEYIDGEVYLLASPKTIHQKILGELHILFHNWFKGKKCIPIFAPYDITLKRNPGNINIVQPDLVIICDLEENLDHKDYYIGVPALAIEIISESTRSKDSIKKLDLYMSTGVKEYWVINPFNTEITIYRFENNDIVKNETYKKNETAASYYFEGFAVPVNDIFRV
jgi:prevent-host-death family protein